MGYCPNCKKKLTCGCQKRVSKNGIAGCSKCIAQLNATPPKQTSPASSNTPTGTTAVYKGPGIQNI